MANDFDVVAVRANHERRIVVGVIVRAKARGAVVLAARLESRTIELIDLIPAVRGERKMEMPWLLRRFVYPKRGLAVPTEPESVWTLHDDTDAKRLECFEEECLARCVVTDAKANVIEHGMTPMQ
jgi:hypothetical protein